MFVSNGGATRRVSSWSDPLTKAGEACQEETPYFLGPFVIYEENIAGKTVPEPIVGLWRCVYVRKELCPE